MAQINWSTRNKSVLLLNIAIKTLYFAIKHNKWLEQNQVKENILATNTVLAGAFISLSVSKIILVAEEQHSLVFIWKSQLNLLKVNQSRLSEACLG